MSHDTRIALSLLGELSAALRVNDPYSFRQWLSGGMQDLWQTVIEPLLLNWLKSFLTVEEQDRLLGFHLGVSFSIGVDPNSSKFKETLACFEMN